MKKALGNVNVNQVSGKYNNDYGPGEFVENEIITRLQFSSELHYANANLKPDHWGIDLLLEHFPPYAGLRLLAENAKNLELEVNWDFIPLVESEWASREEFNDPGPIAKQRFLIVTEGSSDSSIIKRALQLLRPHVQDFFEFVDMGNGYPFSGAGNLFNFTKGLVKIGIQNNIVIIFDNDAEGVTKYKETLGLNLPPNMKVMLLPSLKCFKKFPTTGPAGDSKADINGRAAAIECYLDLNSKYLPKPLVRWNSYNKKVECYQGELVEKARFMKHFLNQQNPLEKYDSRKLNCVLDVLIQNCVSISESKLMNASIKEFI